MNERLTEDQEGQIAKPTDQSLPKVLATGESGDVQVSTASKVDDALSGIEKIELGIDWSSLDLTGLHEGMAKYDGAESNMPKIEGKRPQHDTYLLHESELSTQSGEKLRMRLVKVISPNYHEVQIEITRPSLDQVAPPYVADFELLQLSESGSEEWDMKHRETMLAYRGQGIASNMISTIEKVLHARGRDNGLKQSVSAKSGQRDLTKWLHKRGYDPIGQELEKFERLESMDSGLSEVTVNGKTYTFDIHEFSNKYGEQVSGPEDPAVWDFDNSGKPFFYRNSCFKIKMQKELLV